MQAWSTLGDSRLVARATAFTTALQRIFVWGLLPLVCVAVLISLPKYIPSTWKALHGDGQVGQLTVASAEPGKRCRYRGDWQSDTSPPRVLADVRLDVVEADCRHPVGDRIRSLYVGDDDVVYVNGDYAFFFDVGATTLALAYLTGCVVTLRRARSRRPSPA